MYVSAFSPVFLEGKKEIWSLNSVESSKDDSFHVKAKYYAINFDAPVIGY